MKNRPVVLILLFSALSVSRLHAAQKLFLIDFEGLAEGTAVSDQYASKGVRFYLPDDPCRFPIIAEEGSPTYAFYGTDSPMSSGIAGLTDPLVEGSFNVGHDIGIEFTVPVNSVRFYIIDIDSGDVFTANATSNGSLVDTETYSAGDSGTGNQVSTLFELSGEAIDRVIIDVPGGTVGFALDFLVFTRPCEGEGCNSLIEVAQESSPGAGDYGDHVLGFLTLYQTSATAAEFYAYNVPEGDSWNGFALTPVADRSHLLVADTADGVTLFAVHDRAVPNDSDGGDAEMIFELHNDSDGAFISVKDDPESQEGNGTYLGDPCDSYFTTDHSWNTCCTDGIGISDIEGDWIVELQFADTDNNPNSPAIKGLNHWMAYSADGGTIPLHLVEGRRVRLRFGSGCLENYPGDINGDCRVDMADLAILTGNWLLGVF